MVEKAPGDHKPFWSTLPGILTGIAAIITALTGTFALLVDRPSSPASAESDTALQPGVEAAAPAQPPAQPPPPAGSAAAGCLRDAFESVPADRVRTVSAGQENVVVVAADQTKRTPFALELRDGPAVVGGMIVSFEAEADRYTVVALVDGTCTPAPDLANLSRPGSDARTFPNWDDVRMRLGGQSYIISFGYASGEVDVNLFRKIVE